MHEVAHLCIAAPIVVTIVDLLTLGETDVHIISFCSDIPAVFQHGELKAGTEIIRRFALGLVVIVRTQSEQQLVLMQHLGVTLRQGHHALRLIGDTTCIQERRQVVIIADTFGGTILGGTRTVPETHLITELPTNQSMNLHTEVETCADARGNGIQRIRQDGRSRQRSRQRREERLTKSGQIGMGERCLKLTHTEAQFRHGGIVDPGLLQDVTSRGCRIDTDVIVDLSERLTRKTDDGVRDGETGVSHIVLIIGFVESLVIIIAIIQRALKEEIGFEHEIAVIRLEGKTTIVGNRDHTVIHIILFIVVSQNRC